MKRIFVIIALLLLACASAACEESGFTLTGTPAKGETQVRLYAAPDGKTVKATLESGQTCVITGASGNYYRVLRKNQTLYASMKRLAISCKAQADAPDTTSGTAALVSYTLSKSTYAQIPLTGTLAVGKSCHTLAALVYDTRQNRTESFAYRSASVQNGKIDLSKLRWWLSLQELTAGRKKLYLVALGNDGAALAYSTDFFVLGRAKEPSNLNRYCKITSQERLSDGSLASVWSQSDGKGSVTLQLPDSKTAALLTLEWGKPPESTSVRQYDGSGALLSSQTLKTGFYQDAVTILKKCRKIVLTPKGKNATLAEVRVYGASYPADVVQQWQSVPDKLDLMLFSTHQDDELIFFGGAVPYYSAQGKRIGMVYMANCGRDRYHEAMEGMWTAGLRAHPIFLGLKDMHVEALENARTAWQGEETVRRVVALLRRYCPDVVVTHDINGEYGHTQHKLTADILIKSVKLAADAAYDPASAKAYGVWQVKKLYVHLYEKNAILMDWDKPLASGSVVTPGMLAYVAFNKHHSQFDPYMWTSYTVRYDYRAFGLYASTVGRDVQKNDFFENIP